MVLQFMAQGVDGGFPIKLKGDIIYLSVKIKGRFINQPKNKMQFASSTDVNNLATVLGSNVTTGVSSLWAILVIVVGIPLTFYIIHKIIGLFTRHAK